MYMVVIVAKVFSDWW